MFPTIASLDSITGRPEAAEHDLGSSDLRGSAIERRDPVPGRLAVLDGVRRRPRDPHVSRWHCV
ncbi:hypothetical protein [Haloarchaeobius salinus]|uniref:hypothetical protein n=1 Tax=Haloarchaeobius salinus TaxID=1198298 RepID=UPI00210B3898|nr:hypothetical protein [Haloarchaeobius salinus]